MANQAAGQSNVEKKDAAGDSPAASLCMAASPSGDTSQPCPLCARVGTLLVIGNALFCAACGYASDGISGCT